MWASELGKWEQTLEQDLLVQPGQLALDVGPLWDQSQGHEPGRSVGSSQ